MTMRRSRPSWTLSCKPGKMILQGGVSMNTSEVEALFAQTLLGDYEGEDGWMAVSVLRLDGSREVFEHAAAWCLSDDPLKRARAAAILCQLRRAPVTPGEKPDKPEWM